MLGSGKEKHGDFAGMDGTLLVSRLDPDLDDAQDAVGLRRAWPWPYFLSHSILGFGTSSSSDKSPDVDESENDGYGGNGEREQLLTK